MEDAQTAIEQRYSRYKDCRSLNERYTLCSEMRKKNERSIHRSIGVQKSTKLQKSRWLVGWSVKADGVLR